VLEGRGAEGADSMRVIIRSANSLEQKLPLGDETNQNLLGSKISDFNHSPIRPNNNHFT
jgi:hypothetical protein